jgi:hypothetical protein
MIVDFSFRIVAIALLAGGLFAPVSVHAQSASEGLQVKPAIIEDNVELGGFTRYSITVKNLANADRTFYLSSQDIKGLDDAGLPLFAQAGEQTGYELSSWISAPEGAVTLKSGESKTITFSVHVPSQTNPGAHFGALFLTNTPTEPGGAGSAVNYSVGTIVSLKIAGDIREQAQLREFSTGKLLYGVGVVDLVSKIENSGNVLVRPHGVIEITDMFGRSVGSIEVNQNGAPVFPGSTRTYPAKWEYEGFAFGRYQATASFAYGEVDIKTIFGTTSFWVLPLKPIAVVLGALLAVIVGMYVMIRLYIRRKLRDMGISDGSRDADYYARKYQRSGSRMIVVTLIVFLVCVLFLAALFLAFA